MCGIAGIYGAGNGLPADAEGRVRAMLGSIRHRGPDQFGLYLDSRTVLGSARLSIIDLGGGQQPIATADGRHWIVFNGEIFNYLELREELEREGCRFQTHTDTEVLLQLFVRQGFECLNRLNGQFAFAVFDAVADTLFLARDRLGVRPLFYCRAGGALYFGSEIKCLLAGTGEGASLDPSAVGQVFTFWGPLPGRTVFQGIEELPAGHWMRCRAGAFEIGRYWSANFDEVGSGGPPTTDDVLKEELKDLLVAATRIRLRADVPVGAYLSGGLDSSLIASVVRQYTSNHLKTFSIAFTDERFDESRFQARMAQHLGTEHEVVEATHADIGRVFPEVVWHAETPLLRTAPAPMYLLSRRVHGAGYKVVLTGEGADEFLAGYDLFKEAKVRRFWARRPDSRWRHRLLERLYPDVFHQGQAGMEYVKAFFGSGLTDTGSPDYSHAIRWRNGRRLWRFLSPEALAACGGESPATSIRPFLPARFDSWRPLQQAQYLEISFFFSQYLLSSQGDRVAMANSVEGRYPFLDIRLVEWCNRLPPRLKLKGLEEKWLLRQLGKEWLPAEIWQRTKRPYRAPIQRGFFHERAPAYVGERLSEEAVRRSGLFQPAAVSRLAAKAAAGGPLGETDEMALAGILSTQLLHYWFAQSRPAQIPIGPDDDVKICRRAIDA
jgi:asparagine synthase (glutamine-hydrolysing)